MEKVAELICSTVEDRAESLENQGILIIIP